MRRALFPVLAFVALAVIGCGGGGSSVLTPGVISPTGTPVPHPGPTSIIPTSAPQEVIISGAGYTLKFTLPAVTVGSAATVSAVVQASPPPGVPAVQSRARVPKTIGGTPVGLVYLTLSTTAGVGFASLPSFVWTLPSANVIPSGSSAYMAWYDPAAGQWQTHLGPSTPSGTTVTFPGVAGGFALAANAQYTYALTTNSSVVPTATPAPVPTATPSPAPTPTTTPGPLSAVCPTPTANTFPLNVANNTGITSPLKIYVWGQALPGSPNARNWVYLNDASSGNVTKIGPANSAIPSFTPPPSNCINLPPLVSARVYFYFEKQNTGTSDIHSNGPAIGTGGVAAPIATNSTYADDIANVWDFAEYTWYGGTQAMTFDLTAVDGVGIPSTFWLMDGTSRLAGPYGLQSGMLSQSINTLTSLGAPWNGLIGKTSISSSSGTWSRIVAPQDALGASTGTVSFDPNYMIVAPPGSAVPSLIDQVWNQYKAPNSLQISYGGFTGVGQVDVSNNFNFYTSLPGGSLITTIGKPTSSGDVFGNSGVFVPTPAPGVTQLYANEMGRALSVGILRGTLPVPSSLPSGWPSSAVQPFCGTNDWKIFYNGYLNGASVPSTTIMDWYSAVVHKNAINGLLYGFPDDDSCNNTAGIAAYAAVYVSPYSPGYQWSITLNPF